MALAQISLSVVAVAALAGAGAFIAPRNVHVERSDILAAPPAEILSLAASNVGYQAFNPFRTADPDLKITHFGPEAGVGSGFHFEGKDGKGTQTVARVTASSVIFEIDLGPMGKPTQTMHVTSTTGGSRVVWSMDADMGMNPVARVIGLFMDGMMGKTLEQGLRNLSAATA